MILNHANSKKHPLTTIKSYQINISAHACPRSSTCNKRKGEKGVPFNSWRMEEASLGQDEMKEDLGGLILGWRRRKKGWRDGMGR